MHGLGRHALPRYPIGRADKREVGDQQQGCQQHEQGDQQLAADRKIFKALAQSHGRHGRKVFLQGSGGSVGGQSVTAQERLESLEQFVQLGCCETMLTCGPASLPKQKADFGSAPATHVLIHR